MKKITFVRDDKDFMVELLNRQFYEIYRWFSLDNKHHRYGDSSISVSDRAELLGVPEVIVRDADHKMQRCSDLICKINGESK